MPVFCGWPSSNHAFRSFLLKISTPPNALFDDPKYYLPGAIMLGVIFVLMVLIALGPLVRKGFTSWRLGVTTGLGFLSLASAFSTSLLPGITILSRLELTLLLLVGSFLIALFLAAKAKQKFSVPMEAADLRVPARTRAIIGSGIKSSDEPIESWPEDAVGRAALVEIVSEKLMIANVPVLGIVGELGSGKTSVLNLLREHLRNRAISSLLVRGCQARRRHFQAIFLLTSQPSVNGNILYRGFRREHSV